MKSFDVENLQKSYEDPSFFVNVYNVGRGFTKNNNKYPRIVSTEVVFVWRIVKENLLYVEPIGTFYNSETYLIRWTFNYALNGNKLNKETIFFYWKGANAPKGLSPIPESFDNDTAIVYRIVQWSEPAVFFHIFSKPIIILNEKFDKFNPKIPHLFIVRGELWNELHLIELTYLKKNLRSRAIFLIINPNTKIIYTWKGSKINKELDLMFEQSNCTDTLKMFVKSWEHFEVLETKENDEVDLFEEDFGEYFHVEEECNFTPRLFYLNTMTGEFLSTEIEYSLRSKNHIAAFPFLQSHLITADNPGLFLLDNSHEIWLVSNGLKTESCGQLYNLGTELANNYAKLREHTLHKSVPVRFVETDTDLIEFTNIFPYWNN